MILVFLGPPGAGKGTQAQRVANKYVLAHISTGDMLRKEVREGTELGQKARAIMDAGELVSDEIILAMVKNRLSEPDCKNGALFDGFPRTHAQAEALSAFANVDLAVNIDVPSHRIVERMSQRRFCPACGCTTRVKEIISGACPKCGKPVIQRDDDKEATVLNRLEVYEAQTKPLIEFYERAGKLLTVDGDRDVGAVFESVVHALDGLA